MKISIEYRRDVTGPHFLAGKAGEKKQLDHWHAEQLIEEGYARRVDDPETGEPIAYAPDPPPKKITATKDLRDGTAEQAASASVEKAPLGKSTDTGLGVAGPERAVLGVREGNDGAGA